MMVNPPRSIRMDRPLEANRSKDDRKLKALGKTHFSTVLLQKDAEQKHPSYEKKGRLDKRA